MLGRRHSSVNTKPAAIRSVKLPTSKETVQSSDAAEDLALQGTLHSGDKYRAAARLHAVHRLSNLLRPPHMLTRSSLLHSVRKVSCFGIMILAPSTGVL